MKQIIIRQEVPVSGTKISDFLWAIMELSLQGKAIFNCLTIVLQYLATQSLKLIASHFKRLTYVICINAKLFFFQVH